MSRRPLASFPLLPGGVRDHLPEQSARLRRVQGAVRDVFAAWGYESVITPLYEYLAILERGLGAGRRRETFKFVEPRTGEVVALRPDITPQVARIYATRLDASAPVRLSYDGRVVRFSGDGGLEDDDADFAGGRAAMRGAAAREIFQAGAELIGASGAEADAEVIALLHAALRGAGLPHPQIDVGHGEVARATLTAAFEDGAQRRRAAQLVARKDEAGLRAFCDEAKLAAVETRGVVGLCGWYGAPELLDEAEAVLTTDAARAAVRALRAVVARLRDEGLGDELTIDLGDLRDLDYHDGILFHAYFPGVPEPLGSGGRYDRLVERYGRAAPATGFAIDLETLLSALERAGVAAPRRAPRILIIGEGAAAKALREALRARGLAVVSALPAEATSVAPASYAARIEVDGERAKVFADAGCSFEGPVDEALDAALSAVGFVGERERA